MLLFVASSSACVDLRKLLVKDNIVKHRAGRSHVVAEGHHAEAGFSPNCQAQFRTTKTPESLHHVVSH